ncbi:MAG: TatD family hydrolase, partial [Phycisphaerae bacterium]|nr:TatD family hydrolase [Phycisphaerae bacterium]
MPEEKDTSELNLESLVDSHAHLDFPELRDDLAGVMQRCRNARLAAVINAGSHPDGNRAVIELAQELSSPGNGLRVFPAAGVHPHYAAEATEEHWAEIRTLAEAGEVVALGEFGLDYHYEN